MAIDNFPLPCGMPACVTPRRTSHSPKNDSRPRPRPVARAARSQSRKNRVSFAGRPSVSAWPSRRRETRSATVILEKKRLSRSHTFTTLMICCMIHQ